MNNIHISGMDLNLLLVFDAVMDERNVTRAAGQLGITQSAVSHALKRLRLLLGDPLFVRSPKGMVPTPSAVAVAVDVKPALRQIRAALGRRDIFDPATSTRRFEIGLSDYAAVVLLPGLMERMGREAPGTSLTVKNTGHANGLGLLESGDVELIAGNFPSPPPHMEETLLFEEDFVCAGRGGHAALRTALTMKRYLAQDHLQVSTRGEPHGYVDDVLDRLGVARKVKVTIGHFLVAPLLLRHSNLVATEPRRLFAPLAKLLSLTLKPPPFAIPTFRVVQMWHSRYNVDPGHVWLREMMEKCPLRQ